MCLLALISIDSVFTDTELMNFIESNEDGFGFMRPDVALLSIHTYKQPTPIGFVAKFREWQAATRADGQTTFAMHTRMKTHGAIDFHNAHPHYVTEEIQMMHNGVLNIDTMSNQKNSDTIHYIEQIIRPLVRQTHESAWLGGPVLDLIGHSIGASNKLVFCTPDGFGVVNRHAGVEFRGSWFSNTYAWSLWSEGQPRKKHPAYNSCNYKHNNREYLDGYDMSSYGEHIGWPKSGTEWYLGADAEDQIKNFMEEVDYAAKEHYAPGGCPAAWCDKTTKEYAPAEVKALALDIIEIDGVDGLEEYLDELFSGLSDEDECDEHAMGGV